MNIQKRVGKNVAKLRRQKGWSQEELAFACDLHRTYISGIERGVRNPTVVILEKIATALDAKTALLLE